MCRALDWERPWSLLGVLAAWSWLNAGTLWLNAAVDRDEGEVLFGRSVKPPPLTGPLPVWVSSPPPSHPTPD